MKIVIAVSGGMDSLYTLMHLKQEGHDVAALHARFINIENVENDPVPALSALCKEWNIPFHIADLRDEFRSAVITPFLESYAHGETPNPCAICNRCMKFGRLLDIARNLSAEALATGHYVDMKNYVTETGMNYGLCLKSGDDKNKDQSYFLALTPIESLRFSIFPLAHKMKTDIYQELAIKKTPVPINKESQEVCFVPNDNYREFIEAEGQKRKITYKGAGDIIYRGINNALNTSPDANSDNISNTNSHTDSDNTTSINTSPPNTSFVEKKIGTHEGLWRYTEGQRKGLGIAWAEPLYVIEKDMNSNILYVGNQDALNISEAFASQINFLVVPELFPENLFVRTRFRERETQAKIFISLQKGNTQKGSASNTQTNNIEIELGNPTNKKILDEIFAELEQEYTSLEANYSENQAIPSHLFHVREENNHFESEQEQAFSQQRAIWNSAPISLIVRFESPKQVYAKGQVLAIYDENGFVLAGGVLE